MRHNWKLILRHEKFILLLSGKRLFEKWKIEIVIWWKLVTLAKEGQAVWQIGRQLRDLRPPIFIFLEDKDINSLFPNQQQKLIFTGQIWNLAPDKEELLIFPREQPPCQQCLGKNFFYFFSYSFFIILSTVPWGKRLSRMILMLMMIATIMVMIKITMMIVNSVWGRRLSGWWWCRCWWFLSW